ncbi:MAG: hypothetical protein IJQ99_00460 [Synergistaceae bacterium]|nr:hypothetical protein [Synergistaceae bacterium]
MNYEAEIAALKARIDAIEDEFILLYESVNKRVDDIQEHRTQVLTIWGIVVAVIIGGIQILIALFSKK